jgi:D-arabinitol 4-dehydrogenase
LTRKAASRTPAPRWPDHRQRRIGFKDTDDMTSTTTTPQPLVMLHLGLGSFHRAHQAVYQQALHDRGDLRWQLYSGNIRPDMPELIAALQAQQGAYLLETVSPEGQRIYQHISAIRQVIAFDAALAGLVAAGADPATRIVSFTVTEAGYYLDAKDKLDLNFADLAADLAAAKAAASGEPGRSGVSATPTIYGALTAILRARRAANAGPLTLLNCDNLRHNGDRARSGLLQFITLTGDDALRAWVEANTTSPNAMVDRITPRPTPEVRERVRAATGVDDPAALMGESFIQWVIEDRFAAGRPAWQDVGVQMVASVDAYEEAKIRLLNATHSCIAWAGTLVGHTYIHEGTHDAAIRQMAFDYVTDDTIPVLDTPEHPCPIDLAAYRDVVLARFGNPAIADTNQRVAMDGFSKIPGFIAPTIGERLAQGATIHSVAMLPALFLAYLQRWHAGAIPYTYQDQAMDAAAAHALCDAADPVAAFCADAVLWGPLAGDARLVDAVRGASARVGLFVKEHQ